MDRSNSVLPSLYRLDEEGAARKGPATSRSASVHRAVSLGGDPVLQRRVCFVHGSVEQVADARRWLHPAGFCWTSIGGLLSGGPGVWGEHRDLEGFLLEAALPDAAMCCDGQACCMAGSPIVGFRVVLCCGVVPLSSNIVA